jgi:hypothetical protein
MRCLPELAIASFEEPEPAHSHSLLQMPAGTCEHINSSVHNKIHTARLFLENQVTQLANKFLALWKSKVYSRIHKSPPLDSTLSQYASTQHLYILFIKDSF